MITYNTKRRRNALRVAMSVWEKVRYTSDIFHEKLQRRKDYF